MLLSCLLLFSSLLGQSTTIAQDATEIPSDALVTELGRNGLQDFCTATSQTATTGEVPFSSGDVYFEIRNQQGNEFSFTYVGATIVYIYSQGELVVKTEGLRPDRAVTFLVPDNDAYVFYFFGGGAYWSSTNTCDGTTPAGLPPTRINLGELCDGGGLGSPQVNDISLTQTAFEHIGRGFGISADIFQYQSYAFIENRQGVSFVIEDTLDCAQFPVNECPYESNTFDLCIIVYKSSSQTTVESDCYKWDNSINIDFTPPDNELYHIFTGFRASPIDQNTDASPTFDALLPITFKSTCETEVCQLQLNERVVVLAVFLFF